MDVKGEEEGVSPGRLMDVKRYQMDFTISNEIVLRVEGDWDGRLAVGLSLETIWYDDMIWSMQVLPVGLFSYLLLMRSNQKHLQDASSCRYTAHAWYWSM